MCKQLTIKKYIMCTKEIQIYKFAELSDEAKQRAINKYWENEPQHWYAENQDTLKKFIKVFNLKKTPYGLELQTTDEVKSLTGVRLMAYLFNNYYTDVYSRKYYHLSGKMVNGKYVHGNKHRYSKCQREAYNCALTGYCMDNEILAPIYKAMEKPYPYSFEDLINECYESWVNACERDAESQQTGDYMSDHFDANSYEFTEDGDIY